MPAIVTEDACLAAAQRLDGHVREIVQWHFSPETGCPFWLDWAKKAGWDPRGEIKSFADFIARFPHFQDESLRDIQPEKSSPAQAGSRAVPSFFIKKGPASDRRSGPLYGN